jgi:sulfonate transport system ATP-binding protein
VTKAVHPLAPRDERPPVVRLRAFTRRFGDNTILDALDLDIAQGEFVALLGRSGSGKTTLLRTLAGLDAVAGQEVRVPSSRAVVFQDARLLPWKKVWRNVALGLKGDDVRPRAEAALKEVGLGHRLDAWPATLSGGEAQRVAIGRALLSGPRFLLLDEPLASLDPARREEILVVIERMKHDLAMPILYVSHDRAEVDRLADHVVAL